MTRHLLSLSEHAFETACTELDLPAYRARQVFHWVSVRYATNYESMTNLPKELRNRFDDSFPIRLPSVKEKRKAPDGTMKYRLDFSGGDAAEAVRMPGKDRTTLCLSTQTGCPLKCVFCLTGRAPGRDLSGEEIIGQFLIVVQGLEAARVNVVFMGMGEPLLNLEEIRGALAFLYRSISPRRITVSTVGLIEGIRELGNITPHPRLALSLNAPDDTLRRKIMPVSGAYTLDTLFTELDGYPRRKNERVTLEYVMMDGVNTSEDDAYRLAERLRPRRRGYKVNLIPYNPVEGLPYREPPEETLQNFMKILLNAHLTVTVRRSHGREIGAACGQLTSGESSL